MSHGHAHNLNADCSPDAQGGGPDDGPAAPIDPRLYEREDVRRILAERDIAALYRVLNDEGIPQRTIAALTGQSQSEVSEILKGRKVQAYDVLVRIAEGLGIPRELMGLSYGERGAYGGDEVTVAETPEGVSAKMLRRHVIALGAIATFGGPTVGELLAELGSPSPVPLPAQLSGVHVAQVRNLTRQLSEAGRTYGSNPEMSSAAAAWATRLLNVPGTEPVRRALMAAAAELHIQAGWAGFDGGLYDRAMFHYARALELATKAGDPYCETLALNCAGLATVEHGHPNDGLKMLQVSEVKAGDVPPDHDRRTVVIGEGSRAALEACARADSATAFARLGHPEAADTALAKARERWQPTRTDPGGDLDYPAACLELDRGRLDAAESFAATSLRRWEGGSSQRDHTGATILLATVHVRAGEPDGLRMAHGAVAAASKLSSVRVRRRLQPLTAALEVRSGADARELARMARQVAATRA